MRIKSPFIHSLTRSEYSLPAADGAPARVQYDTSSGISLFPHARAAPLFLNALLGARTLGVCAVNPAALSSSEKRFQQLCGSRRRRRAGYPKVARHPFARRLRRELFAKRNAAGAGRVE
jgi:hypothetical protein